LGRDNRLAMTLLPYLALSGSTSSRGDVPRSGKDGASDGLSNKG
jgi:hypothetical protein